MTKAHFTEDMRCFTTDPRGSVVPIFALSLFAIISLVFASLALGLDSRAANNLQTAADTAALAGASAFITSNSPKADVRLAAAYETAKSTAAANSRYALKRAEVAAVTEDAYGQRTRISIDLEFQPANTAALVLNRNANVALSRTAVAEATWGFPLCALLLATDKPGLIVDDASTLVADNCIVWSNSRKGDSLSFKGGTATALHFCTVGRTSKTSTASVTPKPETSCAPMPDPLAGYDVEVPADCNYFDLVLDQGNDAVLKPGTYCGGLVIKANRVTFKPGIYLIKGNKFLVDAKGEFLAEGVTFLMDGDMTGLEIKSGARVKLVAPATGPTAGIAIAELPGLTVDNSFAKIEGGLDTEGVLYVPSMDIELVDDAGADTVSPYLQIVANSLTLKGRAALRIDFNEAATSLPVVIEPERYARLVH